MSLKGCKLDILSPPALPPLSLVLWTLGDNKDSTGAWENNRSQKGLACLQIVAQPHRGCLTSGKLLIIFCAMGFIINILQSIRESVCIRDIHEVPVMTDHSCHCCCLNPQSTPICSFINRIVFPWVLYCETVSYSVYSTSPCHSSLIHLTNMSCEIIMCWVWYESSCLRNLPAFWY